MCCDANNARQWQQVDSVVEAVRDLTHAYSTSTADAGAHSSFLSHTLPTFLQQLERLAHRCSTSTVRDTLVGDTLSLADVAVYHIFSVHTPDQSAIRQHIDGYPLVKAAITSHVSSTNRQHLVE